MLSICSWRFNHMSTDIGKLCLSTILVMLQELPMSFISSLPNTVLCLKMVRSFERSSV